jgi:aminoglycoside phosphotransferase family enzyme
MPSDMMSNPSPPASEVALESKVAFLRQPTSFPELTYRVEAIETHMSWVFLTNGHAYKLKKPVRYEFLDFSTIDARRFYCEEELRLNRRLAADVYLGVAALAIDASGHLHLDGDGAAVDWLVKMRRLPTRLMLDYAIRHGTAGANEIGKLAARLADFYRTCAPIAIDPLEYRSRFLSHIDTWNLELSRLAYQLPVEQINAITLAQRAVVQDLSALLDERVQTGRIVEGHGDLRPEHVCLRPEPCIIDCLEFSRDLRIIDRADEIAFLALECERLGAIELGTLLLRTYSELSGDYPPAALIHFYQSYRATLRAVISIRHLNEEKFRYSPEWPRRARHYLQLAQTHVACFQ